MVFDNAPRRTTAVPREGSFRRDARRVHARSSRVHATLDARRGDRNGGDGTRDPTPRLRAVRLIPSARQPLSTATQSVPSHQQYHGSPTATTARHTHWSVPFRSARVSSRAITAPRQLIARPAPRPRSPSGSFRDRVSRALGTPIRPMGRTGSSNFTGITATRHPRRLTGGEREKNRLSRRYRTTASAGTLASSR